jgi:hypothetical protein
MKFFEVKDLTLLQFLEHEIIQEYEKAIRCIFDKNWELANKEKPNFHIICMSAILNQYVFMKENLVHRKMIAMQDKSLRENKDLRDEDEEEDFTSETMIDNQYKEFHRSLTEALNARVDHLD